jgi:hypothetical protein
MPKLRPVTCCFNRARCPAALQQRQVAQDAYGSALGGHVVRCEGCTHTVIGYNSCLMGKFGNGEFRA